MRVLTWLGYEGEYYKPKLRAVSNEQKAAYPREYAAFDLANQINVSCKKMILVVCTFDQTGLEFLN
jgi:hypothetical protein